MLTTNRNSVLSDAEIKLRLKQFSKKWISKGYEKGETQLFYRDFFECFGFDVQSVAQFEHAVKLKEWGLNTQYIDLFWPGVLLVEQKSRGRDLTLAKQQAEKYCAQVPHVKFPKYLLACDFQMFHLSDLVNNKDYKFSISKLPDSLEILRFMQNRSNRDDLYNQLNVSIRAADLMANLHAELKTQGYDNKNMRKFLTRLTYCMFADNTGIFESNSFCGYIADRTSIDGTDVGSKLRELFEILDTKTEKRQNNLDAELKKFPYVNGELFKGTITSPAFDASLRKQLLNICKFDWQYVSPDIFGSLFQNVMDSDERRKTGSHYTTEENIMKIINPLFLEDLYEEFYTIMKVPNSKNRKKELSVFHEKLSSLTFFDPACGSGNFLILAYRELRRLEHKVIVEISKIQKIVTLYSKVNVHQFYGIEKNQFSKRLAETSLWVMDHLMNQEFNESMNLDYVYKRIPLEKHPTIHAVDALEIDWNKILPARKCSYILGNPPFGGSKIITPEQRAQVKRITGSGKLDYVSSWYVKAIEYINGCNCPTCVNSDDCPNCEKCHYDKRDTAIGFVATSSITQGEQVSLLWPRLLKNSQIFFAYTPFNWESAARSKATVYVVIIGLAKKSANKKIILYSDHTLSKTNYISPYLLSFDSIMPVVVPTSKSLFRLPSMQMGSKPIDNHHYILSIYEKLRFINRSKLSAKHIQPYVTADEYIHNPIQEYKNVSNYKSGRWIIVPHKITPNLLDKLPDIKERIKLVQQFRSTSKSKPTQNLHWSKFHLNVIPRRPFLVIPSTSTSTRQYVPIGYLHPPYIPNNLLMVIENATPALFGLLTSKMHMAWLRGIGGRMGNGYRYTENVVYNTFPVPKCGYDNLEKYAKNVLNARQMNADASLDQMYSRYMQKPLLVAHQKLDMAVDKLYRDEPFQSDRDRLTLLLKLYAEKINTRH